jgi:succinate-acetate transporter protein
VAQDSTNEKPQLANPGALGLAAFGFTTILLQFHNLGWIESYMPVMYGMFWGGLAQVIAGIIDGKRGDTFGMTAFVSYGVFWIGLAIAFVFQYTGVLTLDSSGLAWTFVLWGVFTFFMMIGTLRMTFVHFFIFASLVVLFALLVAHNFGAISAVPAGVEGLFCGASAVYAAASIIINGKFGRTVLPLGRMLK